MVDYNLINSLEQDDSAVEKELAELIGPEWTFEKLGFEPGAGQGS